MKVEITEEREGYPYKFGDVVELRDDAARHLINRGLGTETTKKVGKARNAAKSDGDDAGSKASAHDSRPAGPASD